jgi:ABC-type transporter Mla maintaining outer membrane lipid asymmetry ATPase subunit MlaF
MIGGSGTGKSVMIKCVLGILRPDSGQIFVDGEEVTKLSGRARDAYLKKFGMLFQGAALFDSLPVWENVAFGLIQGRGMDRKRAKEVRKLADKITSSLRTPTLRWTSRFGYSPLMAWTLSRCLIPGIA